MEGLHRMSAEQPIVRVHGNAYNLFILLLTVFSLVGDGRSWCSPSIPRRTSSCTSTTTPSA